MKKRTESDYYLQRVKTIRVMDGNKRKVSKVTRVGKRRPKSSFQKSLIGMGTGRGTSGGTVKQFLLPSRFSIIENPEESLLSISMLASEIDNSELKALHFDHSKIQKHDLAAELLLGVAAAEVKQAAKYRNRGIELLGDLPASARKKRLIRAMGIVKKLNIEDQMISAGQGDIEIFDFTGVKSANVNPGHEDRKNRCGRLFVGHLNNCLGYKDLELTDDSIQHLLDFVGEIIGNAEDHSGESKWYVCGYLDESAGEEDGDEPHFCEIVIYNFGKSIAETFLELPEDSLSMQLIRPYIEAHKESGLFARDWCEDDLITLASLQSYISSKHHDNTDSDRGQGTVDLIEFFQGVAKECAQDLAKHARMCIVSGRTHILFDDKYQLAQNSEGREVIAFNRANDLKQRPDSRYITHFDKANFPGTMISIRFPLTAAHTQKAEDVDPESD